MEKESCEAKLSKLRLQNKARVTSLNTQLEELKKQQGVPLGSPAHSKKVHTLTQTVWWMLSPLNTTSPPTKRFLITPEAHRVIEHHPD